MQSSEQSSPFSGLTNESSPEQILLDNYHLKCKTDNLITQSGVLIEELKQKKNTPIPEIKQSDNPKPNNQDSSLIWRDDLRPNSEKLYANPYVNITTEKDKINWIYADTCANIVMTEKDKINWNMLNTKPPASIYSTGKKHRANFNLKYMMYGMLAYPLMCVLICALKF